MDFYNFFTRFLVNKTNYLLKHLCEQLYPKFQDPPIFSYFFITKNMLTFKQTFLANSTIGNNERLEMSRKCKDVFCYKKINRNMRNSKLSQFFKHNCVRKWCCFPAWEQYFKISENYFENGKFLRIFFIFPQFLKYFFDFF